MTAAPVFYLGAHHPNWAWDGALDGCRLFISHARLRGRKTPFPRATVPGWALDSMGFSELKKHGRWTVPPRQYAEATARYQREIGRMEWAAGQDHMCEADIIYGGTVGGKRFAGTRQFIDPRGRLSYAQLCAVHQELTVENTAELFSIWPQVSDERCPYVPTLQGEVGNPESYHRCAGLYEAAGIRLADYPVIGVGSVCRIQSDAAIARLARGLDSLNLPLHWYGLKLTGLPLVWPNIGSHDSQAWSDAQRHQPRRPGCTHTGRDGNPNNCANCPAAARAYHQRITALTAALSAQGCRYYQPSLFEPGEAA